MSPQTIPLNDAAVAMLGMCDNDCGRPAVSGFGRGLYKHCSRACERANVVTFDRETVLQLRQESDAAMTVAAKKSNPDEVAAIEAAEAAARDRVRTKIGKKSTLAPVVTPTQKPAPAPIAAPIQVVAVVAVDPLADLAREPLGPFVLRPDADAHPELCRRLGCDRPPVWRGVCGPDHSHLSRQGTVEQYCAPSKLVHNTFSTLRAKIVEIVAKNEGIPAKKVADTLGVESKYCSKAVAALRKQNRLTTPKCNKSLPEYMHLYSVKP